VATERRTKREEMVVEKCMAANVVAVCWFGNVDVWLKKIS
jgi:hypothetical protein